MEMETEAGDDYIRKLATSIRTHEQRLADVGFVRPRGRSQTGPSYFPNVLGWVGMDTTASIPAAKPVVLSIDLHHLFYLLMRFDELGISVGPLDVHLENPARPPSYVSILSAKDKADTMSLSSFRSSLSAVSKLSLGAAWWGRPEPPKVEAELKYMYSAFTKIPALSIHQTGLKFITELAHDPATDSAVPFDTFKNLQSLEILDIDPRAVLGWDRLADGLKSLTIKRSGLEDISDVFIDAVLDDQARRLGRVVGNVGKRRNGRRGIYLHSRAPSGTIAEPIQEHEEEEVPTVVVQSETPPETPSTELPPNKWRFLRHLSLSDNALTFIPSAPLPYLTSLTHLDLSSNLLVSVPTGLSELYNLVSLNLADNMIESVLGIYTQLGGISTLNLSRNRLDSLCGLERLSALERVDLRENRIEDCGEVGRLAVLPNVTEVWVEGNAFVRTDPNYRVHCFDFFAKEGKIISLDGAQPTFIERRSMVTLPEGGIKDAPIPQSAPSPPVVAVGSATATISPRIQDPSPVLSATETATSIPTSPPSSPQALPNISGSAVPGNSQKQRKRKNKRIVDLDRWEASDLHDSPHSRELSDGASAIVQQSRNTSPVKKPSTVVIPPETPPPTRLRHQRYASEAPPSPTQSPDRPSTPQRPTFGSQTIGSRSAPRGQLSPSIYDPPTPGSPTPSPTKDADAFRARIEALRNEVGDSWLKVLSQSGGFSPDASGANRNAAPSANGKQRRLATEV